MAALVVVLLASAEAASAAPGYRYELPADTTYTTVSTPTPNVTGASAGSGITAPFDVQLYDERRAQLFVHTRGFLQLGATFGGSQSCLPAAGFPPPTVFPFWADATDLTATGAGEGVFTETLGVAPNRRYVVEWRVHKPGTPDRPRRFEVIFYESSPVITTVYATPGVSGSDATIGVSRGPSGPHTQFSCDGASIGGAMRIDYIPDPRNLSPPTVSGTARVGEGLQGTTGTWDGTEPIAYGFQWRRCDSVDTSDCDDIAGATDMNYEAGAQDVNRRLRLRVKATNMPFPYVYDDTADSAATALVQANPTGPGGPGGGGSGGPPEITSLSVSPKKLTRRNRRRGRIAYGLSEPATTRMTVQKAAPGRRRGRRCVKRTRRNAGARRCKRFVAKRPRLTHVGGVGANQLAFQARLGRRRLPRGTYRLVAVATDLDGLSSAPRATSFRVR